MKKVDDDGHSEGYSSVILLHYLLSIFKKAGRDTYAYIRTDLGKFIVEEVVLVVAAAVLLGIGMTDTFLVVLAAIFIIPILHFGWNLINAPVRLDAEKGVEIERLSGSLKEKEDIGNHSDKSRPIVVIHYDIDIRKESPLGREKPMTLQNFGEPAFNTQIQDISYKNLVVKFPLLSQVIKGENESVNADVYQDGKIIMLRRDFVRVLEAKMNDTDGKEPICFEARVLYEDVEGTKFCSLHEIKYDLWAQQVATLLKWNGKASELPADEESIRSADSSREERGFLDFVVEGTTAMAELASITKAIGREHEKVTSKFKRRTRRIALIKAIPWWPGGTTRAVYEISRKIAGDLHHWCDQVDGYRVAYETCINTVEESYIEYLKNVVVKPDDYEALTNFRETCASALASVRSFLQSTKSLRKNTRNMRGMSQVLNEAVTHMDSVLDNLIPAIEHIVSTFEEVLSVLDSREME